MGDASRVRDAAPARRSRGLPADPLSLISPEGGAEIGAGALPDDAQVCSCNAVTKGEVTICGAIARASSSATSRRSRRARRPGTSCGSCVPCAQDVARRERCRDLHRRSASTSRRAPRRAVRDRRGPPASPGSPSWCRALRHRHGAATSASPWWPRSWPARPSSDARPRRRAGLAAGHQRPLPGQHAEERHVLGGAAYRRRRGDHAREADRHRRGGPGLRPLHKDHRRPAHRHVRRPRRAAAADLETTGRRRLRVRDTPTARACGR